MKKILTSMLLALLVAPVAFCINDKPVTWAMSQEQVDNDLFKITVSASIQDGYHIYDTEDGVGGPSPTIVTFTSLKNCQLEGTLCNESKVDAYFDDVFETQIGTIEGKAVFTQLVRATGKKVQVKANVEWMACTDSFCTPPSDEDLSVSFDAPKSASHKAAPASETTSNGNLLALIIQAILWGLAALVTPCVFPMIPMTVSFFLKGSEDKNRGRFRAIMYGVFIVLLYTVPIAVLILATKFIGGDAVTADIFNWLSTHWIPNVLFFIIFMVFAASFFGAFEIVLPSKLVNGSDQKAEKSKGLGGVFFLALTLVLVSFSCTGPIVGTVLIKSTEGEFWAPIVTMLAFSLTFALPFALFALFPSALKKLPKSGGWLNSVKVVLGFIEIALGFKFLSVADQVYHWGILNREIYLAIWIVCFTMLGFYLLGKLKFKFDSDLKYISTFRLVLAIIVFSFVVYMIPGMWGAPLKALSGYLPPLETQEFVLGQNNTGTNSTQTVSEINVAKYSDVLELPLGLKGYFELNEAEAAAKASGKPLFIDFTGHGCVNCREMESRVWSDPRVRALLDEKFVICALYTDDKLTAPESEWIATEGGKTLKTIGKINSYIGQKRYGVASQPNYIIQSSDGDVICPARGYNLDVEAYLAWLQQAL